MKPMYFI